MHALAPDVVFADDHLQLMRWDDVFVMRWISPSDEPYVRRMVQEHTRFVDSRPEGTTMALTHVDMVNVKPPDEPTRRLIGQYDEAMHGRLRASATVIAAGGFGGVVVRGIMSGLALVNRRKTPQDVFALPRDGIAFLTKHATPAPGRPIPTVEAMLAAYERACRRPA